MNDVDDFKNYLQANQAVFAAWGDFVAAEIEQRLSAEIHPISVANFLKIKPKPRVKEISSALAKIGRKNYDAPKTQMTDLVGVRFVVLLAEHIPTVCNIIESSENWTARVSKDFEDEIKQNPKAFDYQSKHYEIYPRKAFTAPEGVKIPKELCCEVQVRSLLQHTYAELVHDNIYKPDGSVPKQAEREVAKSMALMETTDDLFSRTLKLLKASNAPKEQFLQQLTQLYEKQTGITPEVDKKTNIIFLETFNIKPENINDIENLLTERSYIVEKVKENAREMYFFSQPVAFLVYWLVTTANVDEIYDSWPLPAYGDSLKLICADLDTHPSYERF